MKKKVSSAIAVALLFSGLGTQAFAATQVDVDNAQAAIVSAQTDLQDAQTAESEAKSVLTAAKADEASALAALNAAKTAEAAALKTYNSYVVYASKLTGKRKASYLAKAAAAKELLAIAKQDTKDAKADYVAAQANTRLAKADLTAASNTVRISVKAVASTQADYAALYQSGKIELKDLSGSIKFIKLNGKVLTVTANTLVETTDIANGQKVVSAAYGSSALANIDAGDIVQVIIEKGEISKLSTDLVANQSVKFANKVKEAKDLIAAAKAKVAATGTNDQTALGGTIYSDLNTAIGDSAAFNTAIKAADQVNLTNSSYQVLNTATSTLNSAITAFNSAGYTAFVNASDALATARTDIASLISDSKAALASAKVKVASVSANDQTALGTAFSALNTASADNATFATAINTAVTANTATATATALNTAKAALNTAKTTFDGLVTALGTAQGTLSTARTELNKELANFNTSLLAERAKLAAVNSNDVRALGTYFTDYQTVLAVAGAFETKYIQVLENNTIPTASATALDTLRTGLTGFSTGGKTQVQWKSGFETAQSALSNARTDLTSKISEAQAKYDSELAAYQSTVKSLNAFQISTLTSGNNSTFFTAYATQLDTLKTAIATAKSANTAINDATTLGSAKTALDTALSTFNTANTAFKTAVAAVQ